MTGSGVELVIGDCRRQRALMDRSRMCLTSRGAVMTAAMVSVFITHRSGPFAFTVVCPEPIHRYPAWHVAGITLESANTHDRSAA